MDCTDLCSEFSPLTRALTDTNRLWRNAVRYISQLWCVSSDDFVLLRLKKEAVEEGVFLVRWSALDYHRIILAVLNKNEVSQHPRYSLGIVAVQ